jgi:hypothetical protein
MANAQHLAVLKQGVSAWNSWRAQNLNAAPDLAGARLSSMDLYRADLRRTNLCEADLASASLSKANLWEADLRRAKLNGADLRETDLRNALLERASLCHANAERAYFAGAVLREADLDEACFQYSNLAGADLRGAACRCTSFRGAACVGTDFRGADLTGALVYGVSTWDVQLKGAIQRSLVITSEEQPTVTVDDLEVAQFLYLLLNNERLRKVIDTITSKAVLILGRFTPERKAVLDALRDELRRRDYLPVLFDFDKPSHRDLTETVSTLAHLARFIVADLTEAKSLPQELMRIVPFLPSVPVQPILLAAEREWGMYETFPRYPWVLPAARYENAESLIAEIVTKVIEPAERKAREQIAS